jgi:aminoglycoside phosphotransferase family enzyme/predicted kinase
MNTQTTGTPEQKQKILVKALLNPACYPHAVENIKMIETHISYVFLTGSYAYKLKKAVNLGFLDFTTLKLRHFFCKEELRLNRRLAPQFYVDLVSIGGTFQKPKIGIELDVIEFAVKMRQFSQEGLLNYVLSSNKLTSDQIDELALSVAAFHQCIERTRPDQDYGCATSIKSSVRQNFAQIRVMLDSPDEEKNLSQIEKWSLAEHETLLPVFTQRCKHNFIRECHGDLHLGNIALVDGKILIFDCIEFNPSLRWIDIINETAFLVMDLSEHGRPDFAWRFLNTYLQETGDYEGLRLLRYYVTYRAVVRAKVARIRASQSNLNGENRKVALLDTYSAYVRYAGKVILPVKQGLIITNGLSGSGKTTVSQLLLEKLGAIRVRSDIERKRLQNISANKNSSSGINAGIYTDSVTRDTYGELLRLANLILEAGYLTIIDAAFLMRWQRNSLRRLADERNIPFVIVSCQATNEELHRRIIQREYEDKDASEATIKVLLLQLETLESIDADESDCTVIFNSELEPAGVVPNKVRDVLQSQQKL